MRAEAEAARDLAREAGQLAASLQGKVAVREKSGGRGPVTEADLRVEELVLAGLADAFPGDAVLSEETRPQVRLPAPRLWCVDPIDGTREYVRGIPEYAVQIGLLIAGEPVAGAIALPGPRQLLWGWRGGGVHVEEEGGERTLELEPRCDLAKATAVHTRRHMGRGLMEALARLGVGHRRAAGGVGFKVALLLLGKAHLYLHTGGGTTWWDSAGPAALCRAAGGTVTDASGNPLDYATTVRHERGLLFAVPGLAEPALARLQEPE